MGVIGSIVNGVLGSNASKSAASVESQGAQQAQQLQTAKDASLQYGRAATILTGTGAASSGDKLGP